MPYRRRLLRFTLVSILAAVLIVFYGVLPVRYARGLARPPRQPVDAAAPAGYGLTYEAVSFKTSDEITLRGWLVPPRNGAVIVLAHATGQTRAAMLPYAAFLARRGYGALLLDLRAYGESGGEAVSFSGRDILAAAACLSSGACGGSPARVGVMGTSLGGLVAGQAAAADAQGQIEAVVIDGAALIYTGDWPLSESLRRPLMIPFGWSAQRYWQISGSAAPLRPVDALPRISPRPLLLISGAEDPAERAVMRRYLDAARRPPGSAAELWEVEGAGHIQGLSTQPDAYEARVIRFFDRAFSGEVR